MTNEEIAIKIQQIEDRSKSNCRRIETMEERQNVIYELATSVKVLATNQSAMNEKLDDVVEDVNQLKDEPGKKWKSLIGYILAALVSSGVTAIAIRIFGG